MYVNIMPTRQHRILCYQKDENQVAGTEGEFSLRTFIAFAFSSSGVCYLIKTLTHLLGIPLVSLCEKACTWPVRVYRG